MYFDVCTVHLVQFINQTNKCTIYINQQYFIQHKYNYMFQCICIILRESCTSILLKLQKSFFNFITIEVQSDVNAVKHVAVLTLCEILLIFPVAYPGIMFGGV